MRIKLKFNLEQWLSNEMLRNVFIKDTDPNQEGFTPSYKKEIIARNEENKVFNEFFTELKKKKTDNKEIISKAYISSQPFPFPKLIEAPKTKNGLVERAIFNRLQKIENKDIYCTLLENHKIPVYQRLVKNLTSNHRERDGVIMSYDVHKGEDSYLNIFRHAILMCPPAEIQSTFEYLSGQYEELNKIDSKEDTKKKQDEIRYDFHKSLRQVDPLGNPNAEMIIWNLLQVTNIPHRAIKAVIEHVKEEM